MAALGVYNPTLLDLAKMTDPDGTIGDIAEMLSLQNDILKDATVMEGKLTNGDENIVRTGIGGATWKKLYGYIQPEKGTQAKVVDQCGMLRRYSEIDVDLARKSGNVQKFVMNESYAAIEAMNQEMASTLFYGNETTEPEAFTGFAPRYNDQSAQNARNILTSAATPDSTDNTSIWLINWSPQTVFLCTPKGSKAGLQHQDFGEVGKTDSNGAILQVYRSLFSWDLGLVVKDWRHVVRINFDLEDIVATGATGPVLRDLMAKAIRRIPAMSMGRPAFYMNTDALDAFDLQCNGNANLAFKSVEDAQGKAMDTFRGIPVRRCDSITSTEAGI
jgi:hypothetical protein